MSCAFMGSDSSSKKSLPYPHHKPPYLMDYYNWQRPHQHNDGVPPAIAENKLNRESGLS